MSKLSPLKHVFFMLWQTLRSKRDLTPEALAFYTERIAQKKVNVSWERDGKFIIGSINVDGEMYMTQATTAQEFVDMVNDVLYAIYNIPTEYIPIMKMKVLPKPEEFQKLNDISIKKSFIQFQQIVATA